MSPPEVHRIKLCLQNMKLKTLTPCLLLISLSALIFLFIAKIFLKNFNMDEDIREPTIQPQLHSVTFGDKDFTYHLNLSIFQAELPYMQRYRCAVLLTPKPERTHDPLIPLLLLGVKSHARAFNRRHVLRQTWARERMINGYRVQPVFLLAQTDSRGFMRIVEKESEEFNDILQWDFMESHYNLSLKEKCFLEWLNFNIPHVHHVFKGDDDVFVYPAALVQYIKEYGKPGIVHGAIQRRVATMRWSKYQVSRALFPNPSYPQFLSGGGFIFPGSAVPLLYRASLKIPVFPLDDVYLGFLILAADLSLRNDKHFFVFGLKFDPCLYRTALVIHRFLPEKLLKVWREVEEAKCEPTGGATDNTTSLVQTQPR